MIVQGRKRSELIEVDGSVKLRRPNYLSTVDAIALYNDGIEFTQVRSYLKDTKDYPWLTEVEKNQVISINENNFHYSRTRIYHTGQYA